MAKSPSQLIPSVPFETFDFALNRNVRTEILPGDGRRASILFSGFFEDGTIVAPNDSDTVMLYPGFPSSGTRGIVLSRESPRMLLHFRDVGSMVNASWWAHANAATLYLTVAVVQYRPPRRPSLFRRD